MVQRVEVSGVGIVEFPDGMSRDEMAAALRQLPTPKTEATPTPAPAAKKEATVRGVDELPLVGRELPSDMRDFGPRPTKNKLGIMDDAPPAPPQKDAFLPIRPEVRQALLNAYDAGTPKERDKLLTIPGAKGDVVREYAQKFEARQDKRRAEFEKQQRTGVVLPEPFRAEEQFGRSVEDRTARLIAAGEKPEFAEVAARRAAAAGITPGGEIKFMQQEGTLEKTDFDFDIYNEYKNANPVIRGAMAGWQGYKQGALGLNLALAELVGAETLAKAVDTDSKKSKNVVKSMGENPVYAARMFEGAINSIAQQVPSLIAGAVTGSTPLVLGSMFAQSFGQEYAEGRQRGLDGADAAQRAGLFAAFEVTGERFGLKFQIDNLRRATRGMKTDELKDFLGNALKKELPGEYLTTTGQFIVDKSDIGLNKDASMSDYLQQMADTTVQTLMQSGLMTAGTKGIGRGVSFVRGDKEARDPFEADYRDLMKEKGFMGGEPRPELKDLQAARNENLETEAPPDRTLSALEKARNEGIEVEAPPGPTLSAMERARNEDIEGAPITPPIEARVQARTVEYERQGYMQDDARLMAERDIAAEARQDVGGRAVQRQDIEDERRTAEGRAERAAMSMEAPSELPEPPSYVTEPSTDEYGTAVPSRTDRTARGPVSAFDRGLDTARSITGELDARERAERASLDANQRRIESDVSQAFARDAFPDLGTTLGASWTRSTLAKNPTPEEYQDAAYARLEELNGQRPADPAPAFERTAAQPTTTTEKPSVAQAPEAVEAKEERQAEPAKPAAPTEFEPLALEAGRNEALEVEPSEIAEVKKAEQALTKAGTPRQRAPGAGRPKSETAKTAAERVAQSNALNKFNRDVALLIEKAKEFSERQAMETFETPDEFEYKEALRDKYADQMRAIIYGLSQRTGSMTQGVIDAKGYIRSLPAALRERAKALHEGTAKLEDYHEIPPKPEVLIERERKSAEYKKARAEGKAKKEALGKPQAATRREEQEELGLSESDIYRIEQQLDMRPDPTFNELTSLSGALAYIANSPNQLEAELAARLLQDDNIDMVGETSFQVVERDTEGVDPEAKAMLDDDAAGVYVPYTDGGSVLVSGASYGEGQGINNEIVLHEAMHAVGAKKIAFVEMAERNDAPVPARLAEAVYQLRDLMTRARETYARLKSGGTAPSNLDRLADAKAFTDIQEFYAYGMTDPDMKLFLKDEVPGTSTKTNGFDRFVDILMKLFGINPELKSGLKDLLLISHEIMQAKKPSAKKLAELARNDLGGPMAAKRDDVKNTTTQAKEETKADAEEAKLNTPIFEDQLQAIGLTQKAARTAEGFLNYFVENYYNLTGTAREFWLGQVPTDALLRTMKRAEIKQGEVIKELMRGANTFKLGQMKLVESLGKEWLALKSKEGIRLAEVMHQSTIARVDPSKDKSNGKLNRMWDALTPEARTVYNKVRDYYTTQARLAHAMMIQNVQNSQMNKESKEKLIDTLEELYGEASRISPYFPLMRFGRFWLQTGRGDNLRFEMFESEGKRNTARAKYLKGMKRKGDARSEADLRGNKELSDGDDIDTLRERMADNSDILKDVLRKISELGNTTDATKESLARDVFQMHLMTLPETKFQKAFIHRKDVEGYSKDGLRSFVTAGSRMASQLAAIKYQPKMRLAFSAAIDSIEGKPTRAKDEALIKALENRVRGNIAPPEKNGRLYDAFDSFVHYATKFTFMYHLTDMRALINNMWSLPSRSAPVLTKHFGPFAVLKQMGKFTRHAYAQVGVTKVDKDGNVSYTLPSFGSSALVRNDPLLQYAVEEMDKRGIATQGTQTFDLYLKGIGESSSKVGQGFDASVRISGALHQGSERITREVTFLTAFQMAMSTPRLGTKKKMTKEEAVEFAHDITDEALYNFLPENMPSWTRQPIARLAIQFHKWAIFTSFYYGSNMREMLKPLPGNTRRGAAYALLGSLSMGAVGSGVTGVFGVSFVMGMYQMLANMISDDDDDDKDILKNMDITRWFKEVYLPKEYGNISIGGYKLSDMMADGVLTTVSGADFASGLSEGSLYFRTTPDSIDFDSALSNSTVTISAPAVGTLAGIYKAGKAYSEGDTLKAVSKFIPVKIIRAPFDAYRLGKEGAKTPGLESKIDPEEFSRGVLFMQALGFRPATLAKLEDADAFINKYKRQIQTTRSDIIRRLVKSQELGRDDITEKVLGEVERFNAQFRHSELAINSEAVENYRESQKERRSTTQRGMDMDKKFYQLYPVRERAVDAADRGR